MENLTTMTFLRNKPRKQCQFHFLIVSMPYPMLWNPTVQVLQHAWYALRWALKADLPVEHICQGCANRCRVLYSPIVSKSAPDVPALMAHLTSNPACSNTCTFKDLIADLGVAVRVLKFLATTM